MTEAFLVSGGSGAIGGALCRRLAAAGYCPVAGYGTNRDSAESVAEETSGMALRIDLADENSINAAVACLAEAPMRLTGVALAASPPPQIAPFGKISNTEWERQWRVNVAGPRALLSGLVRHCFRPHRQGIVVAVLTVAMEGENGISRNMAGYVVAKFGLLGLAKVVAAEYPWLSVHTVSPDFTESPMLNAFDERYLERMRANHPDGRFATPDEVAAEIICLVGDAP